MEAGRELDALVAEKVMGWTGVHLGKQSSSVWTLWERYLGKMPNSRGMYDIPAYSTDIAAAWQVWEKLRDSGNWCCLNIGSDHNICYVIELIPFSLEGNVPHVPSVRVDEGTESASLAICLAALKAVGVSVD